MTILLANATMAALHPPAVARGHLVVDGGRIVPAPLEQPPVDADEVVDCAGLLLIPGNVCAHTHLYSVLARGMPAPRSQPRNFVEVLRHVWWRLDRALDASSIRASALIGALDAIRAGTTTLIDHHASPNAIDGSLDIIAEVLTTVGVRGVLCYEVTDRDGRERRDAGLRENERFLTRRGDDLIRGVVGAHASFTLDDESLDALAELASRYDAGVHIHVAEDAWDEEDSLRRCGERTAARLNRAGILRSGSIAAHAVHVDQSEVATVRETDTWLVHNCRSNMNNGVGRAPVSQFGDRAVLGTDGIDGDMFAESRTAFFRAREESIATPAESIAALLASGARLASQHFAEVFGTFERGAAADLVFLRYDPPSPLTAENLAWHWMFGLSSGNVEHVMVGGKWILRGGEILGVDEAKIRADARQEAVRLWKRMEEL